MPTGSKGFFDTFNLEQVVPLAMKKFDIDLAKRKLGMEEEVLQLKKDEVKRAITEKEMFNKWFSDAVARRGQPPTLSPAEGAQSPILTAEQAGSLLDSYATLGTGPAMPTATPNLEKIMPPSTGLPQPSQVGQRGIDPYEAIMASGMNPKDAVSQIVELSKASQARPKLLTPEEEAQQIRIGQKPKLLTPEEEAQQIRIAAEKAKQKPTQPTQYSDKRNAALKDLQDEGIEKPDESQIVKKIQENEFKTGPKGFETMEEAVEEAKRVHKETASAAGLIPTAEMGAGNKWIPKLVPNIELRIPPFQQGAALPPGIVFNKKTGKYTDSTTGKEKSREELTNLYGERAMLDADKSALRDLSKRYELISIFANRIDANVPIVRDASKLIKNTDVRLYNQAINSSKAYLVGSGQWSALQTALLSLSNEVQRIESNSLGIGGQGQEERKVWAKIHDPNLSFKDLDILLDMVTKLSKTAKGTVNKQRIDLFHRIPEEARGEFGISMEEPTAPSGKTPKKVGRFTIEVE